MDHKRRLITVLAVLVVCSAALPTTAQTVLPVMSPPNPGARSLALGGAFVAHADDATAAYSNPAGLIALVRPELSGELRFSAFGDLFDESDDSDDDFLSIGFLSAVYPVGRFSFAMYRNQFSVLDPTGDGATQFFDTLELTSWGLATAYRVNEDFSLGLGLAYNHGSIDVSAVDGSGAERTDGDLGLNVGLIWRIDERWQLGASYRNGPDVEFDTDGGVRRLGFPSVTAAGVRYRTMGGDLTISAEWDHVWYSNSESLSVELEDQDEVHLGLEYVILVTQPVMALRFGAWRDPIGSRDEAGQRFEEAVHMSTGFGLAFSRLQVDVAFDYADDTYTTSVSGIVVF